MAAGDIQTRNPLGDVQSILNIFKGSGAVNTTNTNTSSEVVSNDKASAYLKQILESSSGLAAVSGAQKTSGLYNSTVNQQLTNDLLSRTAAQTAALSATKTSTTTGKQQQAPQLDLAKTLMAAGAGQVLGPVLKAGSKKLGLDKLGDNIADTFFGSPTAGTINIDKLFPVDSTPADLIMPPVSTTVPNDISGIADISNLKVAEGTDAGGGMSGAGTAAAVAGTAAIGSAIASGGSAAAAAGTTAALTDASYVVGGGIGTWATGATVAAEAGSTAAAAGAAAGVGEAAAAAGTAAEGAGILDALGTAAVALWIICTELNKQGRLPYRYYIYGAREFAKYDERGKQGYYIWAIPSVKHLRKHPHSLYSRTLEVVFNARAEYLSAKAGCKGARKTTLGFITTHGLYALCWTLSRTIARKSYTKDQILAAGV